MHEKNNKKIQSLDHLCGLRVYYIVNKYEESHLFLQGHFSDLTYITRSI